MRSFRRLFLVYKCKFHELAESFSVRRATIREALRLFLADEVKRKQVTS
jgi:hypothetical protein